VLGRSDLDVRWRTALSERTYVCDSCGARIDRDLNAARNLAACADQTLQGKSRPEVKRPDGNPRKTGHAGDGYRRGKAPTSQRRHRKVATARALLTGPAAPTRIVHVSSAGQAPIDFDDVMLHRSYIGMRAYRQSKLA